MIDECLSPALVGTAHEAGFEAYHVVHAGMASWADWNITAHALARDMIFVTNNGTDFRALYDRQNLHPGLVLILPSLDRHTEIRLFEAALDQLASLPDLINKVLEVGLDAGEVAIEMYDWPADE